MKSNGTSGNGGSLEHRPLKELLALEADVKKAIAAQREAERQTRQALIELAQSRGFDAKELLLGGKGGRPARAVASATRKSHKARKPARYKHPSDPALQWSGYGKTPGWLHKLTKDGTPRSEFQLSR